MTAKRTRDPVLRSFLRAAAIAFALGADSIPVLADDEMPEPVVNASAHRRAADDRQQSPQTDAQLHTAGLTLVPVWRGVPDPAAELRLLDARGHKLLQSPVHGRCSFNGLPGGQCTLLIKAAGRTSIRHIELTDGELVSVTLELDT